MCILSPVLQAGAGSTHGYDVVDHTAISAELGGESSLRFLLTALRDASMGCIIDVVPNHMGVAVPNNALWNDVLQYGENSRYAKFFDIRWQDDSSGQRKLVLPFLGADLNSELASKKFSLRFAERLQLFYGDWEFPVSLETYDRVLSFAVALSEESEHDKHELLRARASIAQALGELNPDRMQSTLDAFITHFTIESPATSAFRVAVDRINMPAQGEMLLELLDLQQYRFVSWQDGNSQINYRRFFDAGSLAALAAERPEVFGESHNLLLELAVEYGCGFRIDHPDGLSYPEEYFENVQKTYLLKYEGALRADSANALQAQKKCGGGLPLYVVAEKILAFNERMPESWLTEGTSGYEFLVTLNSALVDQRQERAFTEGYTSFIGCFADWDTISRNAKGEVLDTLLRSEFDHAAGLTVTLAKLCGHHSDISALRSACRELAVCFPVYRTYQSLSGATDADKVSIHSACSDAKQLLHEDSHAALEFICHLLLGSASDFPEGAAEYVALFMRRFQQLTAPATAKGVEDTAFFRYTRLLALNEVGGDPGRFGISVQQFHEFNRQRAVYAPRALSPLSTHDTKRSEDVRARLQVLSEIPSVWFPTVSRWRTLNSVFTAKKNISSAVEYYLYQTLLGALPLDGIITEDFLKRINTHLIKAMREAKVDTSWTSSSSAYEENLQSFISMILSSTNKIFISELAELHKTVSRLGVLNSLSQTVAKWLLPGIPDTYQGSELHDFSLTDPDNRRRVDFVTRAKLLGEISSNVSVMELLASIDDGRMKLLTALRLAALRRDHLQLFSAASYEGVEVDGPLADHAIAFIRDDGSARILVVFARFYSSLVDSEFRYTGAQWTSETLCVPRCVNTSWQDAIDPSAPQIKHTSAANMSVRTLLADMPFRVLLSPI